MKFDDFFRDSPGSPQAERTQNVEGKNLILEPRRHTKSRQPITLAEDSQTTSTDDLMTVQIYLITA